MNTQENNKLIAEFLGKDHELNQCISAPQFHKDWYWLMPVVDKIENYLSENIGKVGYFDECLNSNELDVRYQAVVEFINQYNKNKWEYKTCDRCSYDILDEEGDILEHHCIDDKLYTPKQ